MYGCEGWTIKKAECHRIDVFELWCWRRLLRIPRTARRSNQSILKEISPGCSLEGLMLKLKLQFFGHLMQRADSFEKTLMLGKIERRKRRGRQRMRWLDGITDSMDMSVGSRNRHYWQNGGMVNPLSSSCRQGPRMKELALVILTCFFLSSVELAEKMLRCLREAWESTKPSTVVPRK